MAPISPSYVWEETETTVLVTATCRGATSANTDAFSSPHYVSVNCPPYFLELDLHGRIDGTKSSTAVRRGEIELRLTKAQPGLWGRLLVELSKPERLQRRAESRAAAEALAREQVERKKTKQWDDSRFALNHQMTKDRSDRDRLRQLQDEEKARAAAELASFKQRLQEQDSQAPPPVTASAAGVPRQPRRPAGIEEVVPQYRWLDHPPSAESIAADPDAPPLLAPDAPLDKAIFADGEEPSATAAAAAPPPAAASAPAPAPELPPPRQTAAVTVKFTPKLLPAPARTKGVDADTALPLDPLAAPQLAAAGRGELDISQRDPLWLKERGDKFYLRRDWRAAEQAYGMVLQQFANSIMAQAIDCVLACYSNRAACRLQLGELLPCAADCSHALTIMARARCVTEFPKSEAQLQRCRLRLLTRRAAAYARSGALFRASLDLGRALRDVEGADMGPAALSDRQMITADLQRVDDAAEAGRRKHEEADALLAAQPPEALADGGGDRTALGRAKQLYDEALQLAKEEASCLANRAACALYLGAPRACLDDCAAALAALEREAERDREEQAEQGGQFAMPALPEALATAAAARREGADGLTFEVLRRAAAAHVQLDELPEAARALKSALALRPAHPAVVATLDDVARRAAAAGVDLEPLPPAPPEAVEEDEDEDEEVAAEEGEAGAEATGADAAAAALPGTGEKAAAGAAKPPVGTRGAAQLKADADAAFKEARLGRAVALYGKALKADAAAEWMEGAVVGGLYFRCQCLANRSACHLKLRAFDACLDDAGAALAALGAAPGDTRPLTLKLLARRGMALCQLSRYADAKTDYERALAIDPGNAQLQKDLQTIDAMLGK